MGLGKEMGREEHGLGKGDRFGEGDGLGREMGWGRELCWRGRWVGEGYHQNISTKSGRGCID